MSGGIFEEIKPNITATDWGSLIDNVVDCECSLFRLLRDIIDGCGEALSKDMEEWK